jgi:hypothetical protein
MKCRKNLRTLFAEYHAASAADKPNTALMKLKAAILALKNETTHPSQLIGRADVQADIANDIAGHMLGTGSTLKSRYDDFVWAHHQVMMLGPNGSSGPNYAHRGPAFGPWHRQLLKLYEAELRNAIGDPDLCLPYWDWTKDQTSADPGFPFTTEFLGGDGAGNPNDMVTTGDFSQAAGWILNCDEEGWGFLRRHFGGDGPGLPSPSDVQACLKLTPYDSSPWNWNSAQMSSFRNTLEGWVGPGIHNAVHRWVDGSMQPGTSPNDPVFFLHHCNIDRLWSVWEQKHAAQAPYLPDNTTAAATGLTRLNDLMSTFGRTATDRYFGVDVKPADVVNSKAITWYDSDLPDLHNDTGATLSFVGISEGLTSYKAVKFKVTGCRPVHFRITGLPTAPFGLTTMGTEFVASPDPNADFYYGYVWVQLVAPAGAVTPSAIDIHAYIVDEEGYYAATPFGEYPLADFHVDLTATTVPRQNNSVCLVLDRSGSMADPAGGTSTKSSLLKNAVSVFNALMLPNDEIALVSFDDQIATPAPMAAVSAAAVPPVLAGNALDPRGLTCIGGGMLQGAAELGLASHTNRSMLVLTDGVQNVHPYVGELPAGTITNTTYAIGFGEPQDISVQVLNEVTSNTHGDLIITGDISTDEQAFNLTKYFVQVLAGVSRMDVLLDPQGILMLGSRHVIPFQVSDADVYADIIALCPLPQILDFTLITPSGDVITPATGGGNVEYRVRPQVAFYRIGLPTLPANPQGSHAGTWKAVLALKGRKDLDKLLGDRETAGAAAAALANGGLRYSLTAHAYSNLRFDARLRQDSYRPGASVTLDASLMAYDVPFTGDATVWADVTTPDAQSLTVMLAPLGDGRFRGGFVAATPGVYPCRVRAEGYFGPAKFTREKTLTAAIFDGDPGGGGRDDDPLCTLLHCLKEGKVLSPALLKKLREMGLDAGSFLKCLEEHCPPPREHVPPKAARPGRPPKGDLTKTLREEPKTRPAPRPAVRPMPKDYPRQPGPRIVQMFSREADAMGMSNMPGAGEPMKGMAAKASPPKGQPRRVRRFSRPEEGGTD